MKNDKNKFVLLKHSHKENPAHWDLMLEEGELLSTWRLEELPKVGEKVLRGEKIFDHLVKFLNYEGAVNNGLGQVNRVGQGFYSVIKENDRELEIFFEGKMFNGEYLLKF